MLMPADHAIGNGRNGRLLAQEVWTRREAGGVVDWRLVMRELGSELLLV